VSGAQRSTWPSNARSAFVQANAFWHWQRDNYLSARTFHRSSSKKRSMKIRWSCDCYGSGVPAVICYAIGHEIDHRNESPDPDVGLSLS
jgi:hypothetical protein